MRLTRRGVLGAVGSSIAAGWGTAAAEHRRSRATLPPLGLEWPTYLGDARHTGGVRDGRPLGQLEGGWRNRLDDRLATAPVLHGRACYVVTEGRKVVRLDGLEGNLTWSTQLREPTLEHPIATDGQRVFVATELGSVIALEAGSGEVAWRVNGSKTPQGVVVHGQRVYVSTEEGAVFALAASDGTEEWRMGLVGDAVGVPAVAGGTVYVADTALGDRSFVYAISAGEEVWRRLVAGTAVGTPTVTAERVVVTRSNGTITGLERSDGAVVWGRSVDSEASYSPTTDGQRVYVATKRTVAALSVTDGSEQWSVDRDRTLSGPPVHGSDRLWVPTKDGTLVGLETASGSVVQEHEAAESAIAGVAADQGTVQATAVKGEVTGAFSPGSLEARRRLAELRNRLAGSDAATSATDAYREGLAAFRSGEYDRAARLAGDALDGLARLQQAAESAKEELSTLSTELEEARAANLAVPRAAGIYREARSLYDQGEYGRALQRAQEGIQRVERTRELARSARQGMDALATALDETEGVQLRTADIRDRLNAARTAYVNGDYARADRIAADAGDRFAERRETAASARSSMAELSSTISGAKADGYVIESADEALARARTQYDDAAYAESNATATEALAALDERLSTAHEAERSIREASAAVESARADGLVVGEAAGMVAAARQQYEDGAYASALRTANAVPEEVASVRERAADARERMERARTVDDRQEGVLLTADLIDDDGLYRQAETAYAGGEYRRARRLATRAEASSRRALYTVDAATLVAIAGTGVALRLKPAVSSRLKGHRMRQGSGPGGDDSLAAGNTRVETGLEDGGGATRVEGGVDGETLVEDEDGGSTTRVYRESDGE